MGYQSSTTAPASQDTVTVHDYVFDVGMWTEFDSMTEECLASASEGGCILSIAVFGEHLRRVG